MERKDHKIWTIFQSTKLLGLTDSYSDMSTEYYKNERKKNEEMKEQLENVQFSRGAYVSFQTDRYTGDRLMFTLFVVY